MKVPVFLALREMRHEWRSTTCIIAALVGILTPILIILALKNGVITTMVGRLVENPENRELILIGAGNYTDDDLARLAARADVGFVVPATRTINAVANAVRHRAERKLERRVELIPSAAGDPLAPGFAVTPGEVLLSAPLAEALQAGPGDRVEMRIERRLDETLQAATQPFEVAGVLDPEMYARSALFLSIEDLTRVERFRDDAAVSPESWAEGPVDMRAFASLRLYATSLADLGALEDALAAEGIETRPRVRNVALLLAFQRNLDLLFLVIAMLAGAGFWAAMAANLRGNIERQRVSHSFLRLLSLGTPARCAIPLVQSAVYVGAGIGMSLMLTLPVIYFVNLFAERNGLAHLAWLDPGHIAGIVGFGAAVALTASAWAVFAVKDISADEVLRAH